MSLKLKYLVDNKRRLTVVYVCTDDHKCELKGCEKNLDTFGIPRITIPFDYTKMIYLDKNKNPHYYIGFNFVTNTFKLYSDPLERASEADNNYKVNLADLTKQFFIVR